MSGGSYDYLYSRIEDAAHQVARSSATPLRRAFAEHLRLVAIAMREVEWVDSHDNAPGTEDAAIRACLAPGAEIDAAREALAEAMREAREVLDRTVQR